MRKLVFWLSLAFVFTIPWEAAIEYPTLGSISRVVGIAMAGSWLATVVMTGKVRRLGFFHVAMSVFVAMNVASILWSSNSEMTTSRVLTWVQLLLMSFIFWDLYITRGRVIAALQMYVLGAYVALGDTIANYIAGHHFYPGRFTAAGSSPDDLGVVLALGVPLAAYLYVFRPADRLSIPLKVINLIYILGAFVGIALSGTRTALLAVVPGILFVIALMSHLRPSARIRIGLVLIAGAILLVPQIPATSFQRLGTTRSEMVKGDLNGRVELWRQGLASFERHPLLGIGTNRFRSVNIEGQVAHNSFLAVLVELGAPGLLVFLIIVVTAGFLIFVHDSWDRRLWLCVFIAWGIGASALSWEHRKPTWLLLNLIVASAAVVRMQNNVTSLPYGPNTDLEQPG